MSLQAALDALGDDRAWRGGWYQPIEFPDGSRTHSTKYEDSYFYRSASFGLRKWEQVIRPHLPCPLAGARFLEIGTNAGLYLAQARREGAAAVVGVENHPLFARQARLVLSELCPEAVLVEEDALALGWVKHGPFDLALLANTLYWLVYSDEHGFRPDYEAQMETFLRALAGAARHVLVIGTECGLRYANLTSTIQAMGPHFEIIDARLAPVEDRVLTVAAGRSRSLS